MTVSEAFGGIADLIANMAPEKIVALKAPKNMSKRVEMLINRKKDGIISTEETLELERFLALDVFINLAKARAHVLLTT